MALPTMIAEAQGIVYALVLLDGLPANRRTKSASHALHAVLDEKLEEMGKIVEDLAI